VLSDDDSTGGNGGRSSYGGDSGIQLVAVVYICVHLTTGFMLLSFSSHDFLK